MSKVLNPQLRMVTSNCDHTRMWSPGKSPQVSKKRIHSPRPPCKNFLFDIFYRAQNPNALSAKTNFESSDPSCQLQNIQFSCEIVFSACAPLEDFISQSSTRRTSPCFSTQNQESKFEPRHFIVQAGKMVRDPVNILPKGLDRQSLLSTFFHSQPGPEVSCQILPGSFDDVVDEIPNRMAHHFYI